MAIAAYRLLRERFGIETTMSAIVPIASGFSGAAVFRVQHCEEELCLRCWPRQTSAERVQWVHRRLEQFHENGERRLAIPLPSLRGSTVVSRGPEVWELAPWMDGIADFENRQSSQRLKAAMQVLAQLHDIAERFRVRNDLPVPSCRKLSKGIQTRLQGLERTLAGRLDKISAAVATTALDENSEVIQASKMIVEGAKRLAPGCLRELQSLSDTVTKQFVCLRDVWHDHILFVGDKVTGVIDYDAMEIETPAGDVARLLGSLAGEDETMWRMGLAAYEELRTPEPEFWKLVRGFDSGNLLLSGLQWLEWRFVERREFARSAEATKRISHWARRIGAKSRQNG